MFVPIETFVLSAILVAAILLFIFWIIGRKQHVREAQNSNSLLLIQEQIAHTGQILTTLSSELARVRAETREEAERNRTRIAEIQVQNLGALQQQVHDVVGATQQRLEELRRSLGDNMNHLQGQVTQQLTGNQQVISEVKTQLGSLSTSAQNLQELGKDLASLHDILKAPKLRGNLGELFLEEMLRQVLPTDAYTMQYRLPGRAPGHYVVVDAVVHLHDRLVPIDAKFPLESFQRVLASEGEAARLEHRKEFLNAICAQIDAISEKYIQPEANTFDFALMYLPAENVYYEAVVRDEMPSSDKSILNYSAKKKVVIVSPNTFYAYLLTIAHGLKGLQIEKRAELLRKDIAGLQRIFANFFQLFEKVGRQVELASRHYNDAARQAERIGDQVEKMTGYDLQEPQNENAQPNLFTLKP